MPEEYCRHADIKIRFSIYVPYSAGGTACHEAFTKIVAAKIVSVGSRVSIILSQLRIGEKRNFEQFFEGSTSRSEMVATFLAILSLVKSKQIYIDGEKTTATVELIEEGEAQ